jgi:hypothetical protein
MNIRVFLCLSIGFYSASLLWVFLFPLVSVTTNELKSRQMFVDENALVATSIQLEQWDFSTTSSLSSSTNLSNFPAFVNNSQICSYLMKFTPQCYQTSHKGVEIPSILLAPNRKPMSNEVIVLGVMTSDFESPSWLLDAIQQLLLHIESSDWLSKAALILFIPKNDETTEILNDWVGKYHSGNPQNSMIHYHGIIRFALFIDLLQNPSSSTSLLIPPTSWKDGVGVSFIGSHGLLPNMDTISSIFSLPSNEQTSIHYTSLFSTAIFLQNTQAIFKWLSLPPVYSHKLSHLLLFFVSLIISPSGPHESFLTRHINSFTLIPLTASYSKLGRNDFSWKQLFHLVGTAFHLHSNLHGRVVCLLFVSYSCFRGSPSLVPALSPHGQISFSCQTLAHCISHLLAFRRAFQSSPLASSSCSPHSFSQPICSSHKF